MSRTTYLLAFVLGVQVGGALPAQGQERRWSFDDEMPDALARGFTPGMGNWRVVRSDAGNALAQLAKNAAPSFNFILANDFSARNLDISVRLKSIAGVFEQGGGLVWRAQDARNYYLCRHNPHEENVRLYKVVEGRRLLLQNAQVGKLPGWRFMAVSMEGDHIECSLDGKRLLTFDDPSLTAAGRIGLWTKADAQTEFDDLSVVAR